MSNIQYAVCHLQRGSGSDSGMSCHIERKDTKGKTYVPDVKPSAIAGTH